MTRSSDKDKQAHRMRYGVSRLVRRSACLCLLLCMGTACLEAAGRSRMQAERNTGRDKGGHDRGMRLYLQHCASCHGEQGLGDGRAAYLLYPKPRNFSEGIFRITSTESGLPSDEDIFRTISNGMPGSAMPPWGYLPEADRMALVGAVKDLAIAGRAGQLRAEDPRMTQEEAVEIAKEIMTPGPVIRLPKRPSKINPALGRKIYMETCAACHDEDGRGRKKRDLQDGSGMPIFARDFTQGIFKGGSDDEDLALRITLGMPGSPMPANHYTSGELWSLVQYVQGMIKPGTQDKVKQGRKTLLAHRIDAALPHDPQAGLWREVSPTYLAVMPLWWRDDRIEGIKVRILYNASRIAIHLSWKDPVQNTQVLEQTAFGDGVAIQFSQADSPPLFAMGMHNEPVNIWHWKSHWDNKLPDQGDVEDVHPNTAVDLYDSLQDAPYGRHSPVSEFPIGRHKPMYLTGWEAGNPLSDPRKPYTVENLTARGFGTLASLGRESQNVQGAGTWRNGVWSVVFLRDLSVQEKNALVFHPGETLHIAFAVWDGAAQDRDGQKAVTIWHQLTLNMQ